MNPDDLIAIAQDLARRGTGKPKQASLKRAVSSAYYALFHALAQECVVQTTGWRFSSTRYWETLVPIYRAIDHGAAKASFNRLLNDRAVDPAMRELARFFIELQADRVRADYDPRPFFSRSRAIASVSDAERALTLLRSLSRDAKRELAASLITRQR